MKAELEKKLIEKYPVILQETKLDEMQSCLAFGLEISDGWYDILDMLMRQLQWNTDKNGYPQVIAQQIKEKFGGLRFYYRTDDLGNPKSRNVDETCGNIEGMIRMAEAMCDITCEQCGAKGETRKGGWIVTLCDECNAERGSK